MKRLNGFFSKRGFYIALSVGVFAFAALMVAGDIRETKEEIKKEQSIDLNEPADPIADATDASEENITVNEAEKTTETNELTLKCEKRVNYFQVHSFFVAKFFNLCYYI